MPIWPARARLNFVVGVNGSGKSSILRTLYRCFPLPRPPRAAGAAADPGLGPPGWTARPVTALLHITQPEGSALLLRDPRPGRPSNAKRADWEALTRALRRGAAPSAGPGAPRSSSAESVGQGSLLSRQAAQAADRLQLRRRGCVDPARPPEFHPRATTDEGLPGRERAAAGLDAWSANGREQLAPRRPEPAQAIPRASSSTNRMLGGGPAGHVPSADPYPPDLRLAGHHPGPVADGEGASGADR